MFKKLKKFAAACRDKIAGALDHEWGRKKQDFTTTEGLAQPGAKAKPKRWPAWKIREFQRAAQYGTSKHRGQRGVPGAFGQSRANREAKCMPTTRKEQHRLGWWLPELPDENA